MSASHKAVERGVIILYPSVVMRDVSAVRTPGLTYKNMALILTKSGG
jgi:hypothetical protein